MRVGLRLLEEGARPALYPSKSLYPSKKLYPSVTNGKQPLSLLRISQPMPGLPGLGNGQALGSS